MSEDLKHTLSLIATPNFRQHALEAFFEAMRVGYATAPEKGTIKELPGSKTIEYVCEKWRMLDTYLVAPNTVYSGGMTCMFFGGVPVWMMHYSGGYREEGIPCLKAALRNTYRHNIFYGGRGPRFFQFGQYAYINTVAENDFHGRVCGEERIFDSKDNELVGYHQYHAQWMVGRDWSRLHRQ